MEEELICLDEITTKIRPDFIQNLDQLGKKSIYKISDCNISKIGIGYASIWYCLGSQQWNFTAL